MSRGARAVAVIGWLTGFTLAGWILLRAGRMEWLRVDWSDPLAWLETSGVEVVLAALARLSGLAVVAWVLVSTVLYAGARLIGAGSHQLAWLSIAPLRRAVDALLAGSLLLSSVGPARAMIDPETVPTPPAAESVDPAYVPVPAGWPPPPAPDPIPAPTPPASTPAPPGPGPVPAPPAPGPLRATNVVVRPGDDLWRLAAARLQTALGRVANASEIGPYWVEVVEANRARLRSGDPDLIFPGEELWLPPFPSGQGGGEGDPVNPGN